MSKTFKIFSSGTILDHGFPEESFMKKIEGQPDLIIVDAGTHYLCSGKVATYCSRAKFSLRASVKHHIPMVIGSAAALVLSEKLMLMAPSNIHPCLA